MSQIKLYNANIYSLTQFWSANQKIYFMNFFISGNCDLLKSKALPSILQFPSFY